MGRGLREGDPLSPFLFLIVVEGLNLIFKEACSLGLSEGYKAGGVSLPHLQFADTLITGDKCSQNIWSIKALLHLFECVSGLKINFHKSQLIGVNVDKGWVQEVARFLNCKVGLFPFIYLGLPVGADAWRKSTWQHVLEKIRGRLSAWNSKFLSLGGEIVLLKSVLHALPIYYLSFFKAPEGIIDVIGSLFRNFLRGGSEGNKKIHWVAWSSGCGV